MRVLAKCMRHKPCHPGATDRAQEVIVYEKLTRGVHAPHACGARTPSSQGWPDKDQPGCGPPSCVGAQHP